MYRRFRLSILSLALVTPLFASAGSFEFVHVEYNPEGSDAKREWVRVKNVASKEIDLSGWKFFENNTNHRISPVGGSLVPAGGTAVIAADAATFLSEYPASGDVVFDSAFSLSQSGEALELRDADGAPDARIAYSGSQKPKASPRVLGRTAEAPDTTESRPLGIWPWLVALGALIALSGFAVVHARAPRSGSGYTVVAVERETKYSKDQVVK